MIFVYREETPSDVERVRPRGLRPETTYRVRFQENPRLIVAKGQELMENGFDVPLPSQWLAEVVYIEPDTAR